jgi:transposase-like protein
MDPVLAAFRRAAANENRERNGARRRYSVAVRQRAIAYWQQQRQSGVGVRRVAAALGVAHWSLHRWIRAATSAARFRPVSVVTTNATPSGQPDRHDSDHAGRSSH